MGATAAPPRRGRPAAPAVAPALAVAVAVAVALAAVALGCPGLFTGAGSMAPAHGVGLKSPGGRHTPLPAAATGPMIQGRRMLIGIRI